MIKKISYLFVFVISLFSLKFVNAESFYINDIFGSDFDDFNEFLNMSDNFSAINDIFNAQYKDLDFDICFINHGYPLISCYGADLDNLVYISNSISIPVTSQALFYFYSSDNYYFTPFSSISFNHDFINSFGENVGNVDIPIWVRPDYIYSGVYNVSFTDDSYESFNPLFKQYYNFKDYLFPGNPIISYFNLFLGNLYKTKTISLNVCINNSCDLNKSISIDIKYDTDDQVIDILDLLPKEYENFILDSSKEYKVVPGSSDVYNVYYVSEELDYNIYFYFDGELQSDRTISKKGFSSNLITIDFLDPVIDDIYFLDDSYDYSFTLTRDNNFINIYYRTIEVTYFVNVYLDDIYYQSHSLIKTGLLGSIIVIDDLEEVINIYTLDQREYTLSLTENQQLNYVNVYYYSNNYNTKYQDIDTSDKFYIAFDWVYIKELFNLHGEYTQTEQFVILYAVNILFYVIIGLFIYIGLKMLYKLLSFIGMF